LKRTALFFIPALLTTAATGTAFAVDSLNVSLVGRLNLCWNTTGDLDLQNGLAYLPTGYSGLRILDVSTPEHPEEIGWCDTWGSANSVAVAGGYAYVTTYWGGFRTYDISDPAQPVETDVQDLEYMLSDVLVHDDHVLVAGRWEGLYIFNLEHPAYPQLIGQCPTPGYNTFDLDAAGSIACLVDTHEHLRVVNIADPFNPYELSSCEIPHGTSGVAVQDGWAYVTGGELYVVDLSTPETPQLSGSWAPDCSANGVELHNGHAWVMSTVGLFVASLADPGAPFEVFALDDCYANGIAFDGNLACLAAGSRGLRTLDVSDPAGLTELGNLARPLRTDYIAVEDNLAAVALGGYAVPEGGRLQLVDLTDPAQPQRAGALDLPAVLSGVAIAGNYVFAPSQGYGLSVIDVSDPEAPFPSAACDTTASFLDIDLSGDYAFVAVQQGGLRAIDISDPLAPEGSGDLAIANGLRGIAVSGNYICAVGDEFIVVDASDPEQMEQLGSTNTLPGFPMHVAADGTLACVIWIEEGAGGVAVMDIADPANPDLRGWCYTPGGDCASGITIRDHYACVADQAGDLQIVDFSDPDNLAIVGTYPMPDRTRAVAWPEDELLYAVDGNELEVFEFLLEVDVEQEQFRPQSFAELKALPNPFNDRVTLEILLAEHGTAALEIYDILGRRIDRMELGMLPAGSRRLCWRGPGGSGIYFVLLQVDGRRHDLVKITRLE